MRRIAYFQFLSPIGKILFLLSLIMLIGLATALTGLLIGEWFLDVSMTELADTLTDPQTREHILFGKFYQVINQFGVFIIPVLIYTYFVSSSTTKYLKLGKAKLISFLIAGLTVYTILPFINFVSNLNEQMVFPEALSGIEEWMKSKELQASVLTENFLKTSTIAGLMLNIFIVALIPAVGEEMLFRGVIQRLIQNMVKNVHWAVIISALIFSAFHLQFYGFLPRFALGVMLGYLFVITGSLWVPIFVHFLNNISSVIVYFLHYNGYIKTPMEDFGSTSSPAYIVGSLLITVWLLVIMYRKAGSGRA